MSGKENADMAELADALDLGSSGESRAGSSPVIRILWRVKPVSQRAGPLAAAQSPSFLWYPIQPSSFLRLRHAAENPQQIRQRSSAQTHTAS